MGAMQVQNIGDLYCCDQVLDNPSRYVPLKAGKKGSTPLGRGYYPYTVDIPFPNTSLAQYYSLGHIRMCDISTLYWKGGRAATTLLNSLW